LTHSPDNAVVAKFRIDSIASLARQMVFTPTDARSAQLNAAEALLHAIEPARAYPLDFVTFKITGYRPRAVSADQLPGLALQHDLGLLIERVSQTLDVASAAMPEPVLDIADVTDRFSVTSKTIQRWRRRGLPARRFVFPDGKRRVGFLLSSVERFVDARRDQVERGANFSQVGDAEREEILRRARRLASMCHCCVNEISRRIARKLRRSPLTILHTIRKHDAEHAADAIFPAAAEPFSDAERARIVRLFRRGVTLKKLARRTCRTRSAVYRVVLEERVAKLNRRKVRFIDDPLYHQPDAQQVMEAILDSGELAAPADAPVAKLPRDVPDGIADLCRTAPMSPARERAMFLKLNFHKMQFAAARRKLDPELARARDLNVLEAHLRRAMDVKNEILRANLRLVVSVARRHLRPGLTLGELVSDGTMTLMRAVDSFDTHRGNKFSTYATFALMKGFARSVPQMLARRAAGQPSDSGRMIELPDRRVAAATNRFLAREELSHLLQRLDTRERDVLSGHFGLGDVTPASYEQLGRRLGISMERVRQIEQLALAKLRVVR
jgi:RNA polymerase sigma factor (sigma-70 family)